MRDFSAQLEALAKEWRGRVVDEERWREAGPPGGHGGEAAGFFVRAADGVEGFAKPGRHDANDPDIPRAAHEKIASDLAYDLGLPIPPVILCTHIGGVLTRVAISAVPFTPAYKWSEVQTRPQLATRLTPTIAACAAAMAAFDTWVSNGDRHNAGNLIVGEEDSALGQVVRCAYIDYSFSLGYSWRADGAWETVNVVNHYPSHVQVDVGLMNGVLECVERLDQAHIEATVKRVPSEFLTEPTGKRIIRGLLHRQRVIRAQLRKVYPQLP